MMSLAHVFFLLTVCLLGLNGHFWFNSMPVWHLSHLKSTLSAQQAYNTTLKNRNEKLEQEINILKSSLQAREVYAREQLNMIKTGETFVHFFES